jgi:predicted nucleic acid-binding protein
LRAYSHTVAIIKLSEAVARQLVTPSQVVKKLRERPDIVRQLKTPNQCVQQIKAMKIEIAPLTAATLEASAAVRQQYGLLTNDSLFLWTDAATQHILWLPANALSGRPQRAIWI